ncbi:MAG: hypothetical protein OXG04_02700 [Acidobacteria bacterium]|nr:hypothetical protein [Acidobacteriota bacterium]
MNPAPNGLARLRATLGELDWKGWTHRFGAALKRTVAGARPFGVPVGMYRTVKKGTQRQERHRRYLEMATLANTDADAAKLFDESHLWLDTLPDGVLVLLREHPAIAQAWSAGSRDGFHLGAAFVRGTDDKSLISRPRQVVGTGRRCVRRDAAAPVPRRREWRTTAHPRDHGAPRH